MKFLFKIAIIILTARVLAGTPRGGNREVDAIGDFSLRDVAHTISATFDKVESAVAGWWSQPAPQTPKVATNRRAAVRHPGE